MDNNLDDLFQRYLDKTATPEEQIDFLARLQSGDYDHLVDEEVKQTLFDRPGEANLRERNFLENNWERLRAFREQQPVKTVTIRSSRPRLWMAAAATLVLTLICALWILLKNDALNFSGSQETAQLVRAGKQVVMLPDGSQAVLNEGTKLTYDASFSNTTREVFLSGEAFFDIAHDATRPFIVHTGDVATKVLGTAFNINAYPGQAQITVTVLRGRVEVGDDKTTYAQVRPDEQIAVDVASHNFVKKNTNAEAVTQWKAKFIVLDDVTLGEAAATLEEKFKVKITFANDSLKACRFDGTFVNDESLREVLALMSTVVHMQYTIEPEGDVVLNGKGCATRAEHK